jgi:Tryptophan halogenase
MATTVNRKKTIGIIGAGSAAAVSAAACFRFFIDQKKNGNRLEDIEVTSISDPNISIMKVGESMSPSLLDRMTETLDMKSISDYDNLDMIFRIGSRQYWENETNPSFDVTYAPRGARNQSNLTNISLAGHFNSEKFSSFAIDRLKVLTGGRMKEIHDNIKGITQTEDQAIAHGSNGAYSFDYIFDCRGFPTEEEFASGDYKFHPEVETVNSVLLFQHHAKYNEPWTDVTYHNNGWSFGIPTRDRKAYGYLYNRDITGKDEAVTHFKNLFNNLPIKEDDIKEYKWRFYNVKRPLKGRVLTMGNKLYFFEPIQGIPLHHYFYFTYHFLTQIIYGYYGPHFGAMHEFASDLIGKRLNHEDFLSVFHQRMMDRYLDIISSLYVGNRMNSEFWRVTGNKAYNKLLNSPAWIQFCRDMVKFKRNEGPLPDLTPHPGYINNQYMEGLNVNFQRFLEDDYIRILKTRV